MQRLEVSGVVRLIYRSLGVKGLFFSQCDTSNFTPHRKQKTIILRVVISKF